MTFILISSFFQIVVYFRQYLTVLLISPVVQCTWISHTLAVTLASTSRERLPARVGLMEHGTTPNRPVKLLVRMVHLQYELSNCTSTHFCYINCFVFNVLS